jgi:hypothetical protein
MQQRLLTDDEIGTARAMVSYQFWAVPVMFGLASLGLAGFALGGNPTVIFLFVLFCSLATVLWISRVRDYHKVAHDIQMRIVEVVEGGPDKVWVPRHTIELTKLGFCYVRVAGRTIRVPSDSYGELREANIVKITFLPTALVAVRIEAIRGIGQF